MFKLFGGAKNNLSTFIENIENKKFKMAIKYKYLK